MEYKVLIGTSTFTVLADRMQGEEKRIVFWGQVSTPKGDIDKIVADFPSDGTIVFATKFVKHEVA